VSWPSWLTYSVVNRQLQVDRAWKRESSPVKDQRPTTAQRSCLNWRK